MKAIILAAGYGNRMKHFTNSNHKTLLKIKYLYERDHSDHN
jgi:choline kinase